MSAMPGRIRDDFPMLREWNHFNCGGMAPLPRPVGEELLRVPSIVVEEGPLRLLSSDDEFLGVEASRAALARFIGADPDEICFTSQFAPAANTVVQGIDWKEGDHFIVTDQEHPALLIPLMNAARRYGLTYSRIPVSNNPDEMLQSFDELVTDRTRLLAVSHVTTDSGTRLPAEEMTKRARERGMLVMFDGAHSVGQFPVDLHALDCDFYAMVGYKWLLGPYPSAALYVRSAVLNDLHVTWPGSHSNKGGGVTMGVDDLDWVDGARRFEQGGRAFSYDTAMGAGVTYVSELGVERIQDHARHLSSRFHAGLADIPGAQIHSPTNPSDMTGINTVSLESMGGTEFSATLREKHRIVTRPALRATSVRFSLACYTEERDVDNLLEVIASLA